MKAVFIWLAAIAAIFALIWLWGFLYWQVRIGRAIADLKRVNSGADPAKVNPDLLQIGSRGIPRFVNELDQALLRGDDDQARAFYGGLSDLVAGFFENGAPAAQRASAERRRPRSQEEMWKIVRDYRDMEPETRDLIPPWWKWWTGRIR